MTLLLESFQLETFSLAQTIKILTEMSRGMTLIS
jgi:hypothetical protein